jgi:hypothetical protein
MLEKSNSANVEPVFTTNDGKEIVLGNGITKLLDDILEQAFIPFIAEALYNAGYRKQKEGEWVYRENEFGNAYYACSICDCQTRYKENYCSSCGAKMKGADNG